MKKVLAILVAALAFVAVASAQPRAIGIRGGYPFVELSYQHSLGSNFAEFDLGMGGHSFYLTGVYDFVFANSGDFNFYAGPGAQVGFYSNQEISHMSLALVGQLGAEFQVPSIPLNLSLDWMPAVTFNDGAYFNWRGFALGIRYRF